MTNPGTIQAQNQGYEWSHHSIYRIYKLLENVKRTNLQIQSSRISKTQDNSMISKMSPIESSLSVI